MLLPKLDCLCVAVEVLEENKSIVRPLLVQEVRDSYELLYVSIGVNDFDR